MHLNRPPLPITASAHERQSRPHLHLPRELHLTPRWVGSCNCRYQQKHLRSSRSALNRWPRLAGCRAASPPALQRWKGNARQLLRSTRVMDRCQRCRIAVVLWRAAENRWLLHDGRHRTEYLGHQAEGAASGEVNEARHRRQISSYSSTIAMCTYCR